MTSHAPPSQQPLPRPFAEHHVALPYAAYQALLKAGPVHHTEVAPGLAAWLVCGYGTARTLMADPRLSIEPASTTPEIRAVIDSLATEEKQSLYGRHLLATDPPDHTRMRRVMAHALTARRLRAMEPRVVAITEQLLVGLDADPGRDEADLLSDFILPLTIRVLAELIGLPPEGTASFEELGLLVLRGHASDSDMYAHVISSLAAYFGELLARPEGVGEDGLLRMLLTAHTAGEIEAGELNSLLFQLFFAGHESTGYFIANAMANLLSHPDQLALLRKNSDLISGAVEELLRFEGSVKSSTWRFPMQDIDIEGTLIPRGEPVLILFAAANRDPDYISDPDRLDITRPSASHLSFGHGVHHCLGNALGRMEAKVAIGSLIARYPGLRLSAPHDALPWRANIVMRGMSSLPVTLHSRN
ncbi:cytochrome P450 [Streptomyces melanogenes]|uniref:cytochrome P450 n=1 Tax=Streptomyces melanogenes TaxID=67326 RepID=UPI00378D566B